MKNLFLIFTVLSGGLLSSCSKFEEPILPEYSPQMQQAEDEYELDVSAAVFSTQAQAWIVLHDDPYKLENIQAAYDKLSAGGGKLQATHRVLKVWPKTEVEQRAYELDEELSYSYTPMNSVFVPKKQVKFLPHSVGAKAINEETRYTVSYTNMISSDGGSVEDFTIDLPVLYVVWPVEKTIPADMDYEWQYDVFLPQREAGLRQLGSSEATALALDCEAVGMTVPGGNATRAVVPLDDTFNVRDVLVQHYDTFKADYVPMAHLKVEFIMYSNRVTAVTDTRGRIDWDAQLAAGKIPFIPSIRNGPQINLIFDDVKWKIVASASNTTTIVDPMGAYNNYVQGSQAVINLGASSNQAPAIDPRYEIHRAVNYYYYGGHGITTGELSDPGIRIIAMDHLDPKGTAWGKYNYDYYPGIIDWMFSGDPSRAYIEIFNDNRNRTDHIALIGTVLHELGHLSQHAMIGHSRTFANMDKRIKESWASFVGWYLAKQYYASRGKAMDPSVDWTYCSEQEWMYNTTGVDFDYSPLFVDLVDDYNQWEDFMKTAYFTFKFVYDPIENVPIPVIERLGREARSLSDFKSILSEYIGVHFSQIDYIEYFDSYERGEYFIRRVDLDTNVAGRTIRFIGGTPSNWDWHCIDLSNDSGTHEFRVFAPVILEYLNGGAVSTFWHTGQYTFPAGEKITYKGVQFGDGLSGFNARLLQ